MKRPLFLLVALLASAVLGAPGVASAFGPYADSFDGTATVKTGKKVGALTAVGLAQTSDGSDATVTITGDGPRGTKVAVTLVLAADGKASLDLVAKVLADPKQSRKRDDKPLRGKKVVVRTKAKGTYVVNADNTVTFTVSGNSGKGGGTQITGTYSLVEVVRSMSETDQTLSVSLTSGFKQKLDGVGRKLSFSFVGTGVLVAMTP